MMALCLGIAFTIFAASSLIDVAKSHIEEMRSDGSITNVVNMLIENGTVCNVRGHKWEAGCGTFGCLVIHTVPMRHCIVCGLVEGNRCGVPELK